MAQVEQVQRVQPAAVPDYDGAVERALTARRLSLDAALRQLAGPTLPRAAELLVQTLRTGHKVLVAGNGGSAAEAQHFAAELVGRFKRERSPYAALALTTDSSILTAIGNDYGYEEVFARQVCALGQLGDLLLTYSTSGESENLIRAALAARERGLTVLAVTGSRRSRLGRLADLTIRVVAEDTAVAQELHMMVTHTLCAIVEAELAPMEAV